MNKRRKRPLRPRPPDPGAFKADAAEERRVHPCTLCGAPTLNPPEVYETAPWGKAKAVACSPQHARILREAICGEPNGPSPSTVVVYGGNGFSLALRAFTRRGERARVRFHVTESLGTEAYAVAANLTPREARRLAGALLRAANRAEGVQERVAQA